MGSKRILTVGEHFHHRAAIRVECPRCHHRRTYSAMGLIYAFEPRTNANVAELRFRCSRCGAFPVYARTAPQRD